MERQTIVVGDVIKQIAECSKEIAQELCKGNDIELRLTYKGLTVTSEKKKKIV